VSRRQGDKETRGQGAGRFSPLVLLVLLIVTACTSPAPTGIPTRVLSPDPTSPPITCASLDVAWATADWQAVLEILDQLETANLTCGENSLAPKRYAAYINHGVALEDAGQLEAAIEQYQAALNVDSRGHEALNALSRLKALPTPTPPTCNPSYLAPYVPSSTSLGAFISIEGDRLVTDDQTFIVRGVNYYPRHAPWDRFLTKGDLSEIAKELDLIASAGFNTLRIFLWYDPLFICTPEEAVPNTAAFTRLDTLIALARKRGLYLIVTLNDLPDLFLRPLYTDWARYDAQTTFIVRRYRDEPAILAWDLRNEGDLDYGANTGEKGNFEQETVLAWLRHAAALVRANDEYHLLTAGWWGDAAETAEIVDVLSFHHWGGAPDLVSRIETLRATSAQPILVEEVGCPSWGSDGETSQAQMLGEAIEAAEGNGVAGWLVWTAFDFAPADGSAVSPEHCFGLWRLDLTAKPALGVLPVEAVH
jgi:tetratricopeptide (TPR) repeat protein